MENAWAGFGNALSGIFSLSSQSAATWDFAYVVVPLGSTVDFDFQIAAAGFAAESIDTTWTLTFPPGDVNMDGIVNGQDISVVASNWLLSVRYGDANFDGIVNGQDVSLIASNWLSTGGGTGAAVPEPSGATLAVFATLGAAGFLLRATWQTTARGPAIRPPSSRQS